jgi:hypothetical protein
MYLLSVFNGNKFLYNKKINEWIYSVNELQREKKNQISFFKLLPWFPFLCDSIEWFDFFTVDYAKHLVFFCSSSSFSWCSS